MRIKKEELYLKCIGVVIGDMLRETEEEISNLRDKERRGEEINAAVLNDLEKTRFYALGARATIACIMKDMDKRRLL